jgi:methylenetetrahydrofolate dehydrogenase (NADP+)/methenyltetrahydrofolate cyclohydrolase
VSAILDGKRLAAAIKESLAPRIAAVKAHRGREPGLLVIASGHERASSAYFKSQKKACESIGMRWELVERDWNSAGEIIKAVAERDDFDAVILDRPLPDAVHLGELFDALAPARDAEGVTAESLGRLYACRNYAEFVESKVAAPCTAVAVAELLRSAQVPLAGKTAVVLGRSNIVGKPAAHLLSCLDLTVTLCHSKTADIASHVRAADVVVAAIGKPRFVKAEWLRPGAIVLDAGINAEGAGLVGDCDPAAYEKASLYTPVPGGVGPVTTAVLLANAAALAEKSLGR